MFEININYYTMKLKDYLKNNSKKYLIFDLDLTLFYLDINWQPFHQEQYEIISQIDKQMADRYLSYDPWSNPWRNTINEFIKKHGEKASRLMIEFTKKYEEKYFSGKAKENKGLTNFIRNNKNKYLFYILSNNSRKTIKTVLTKYQLVGCFEKVVSRDDVSLMKPDSEGFYLIYKKGEDRKNYLMIGDSEESDGRFSRASEIDFFKDLTFGSLLPQLTRPAGRTSSGKVE